MEVLTFSDGEGDEEEFAMTGSVLSDYFTQVGLDHNFDSSNDALDDQHPKSFQDITAGEFLEERLQELGLRK